MGGVGGGTQGIGTSEPVMLKTVRTISMSYAFIVYHKRKPSDLEAFYRLYGVPGEVYLEFMDKFDYAPVLSMR